MTTKRRRREESTSRHLFNRANRFSAVSSNVPGLQHLDCDGEVIVQGDEGPVCGVAQGVDCHGVTVGHEEREEEKVEQEVEGEKEEKTLKERCACPWMG